MLGGGAGSVRARGRRVGLVSEMERKDKVQTGSSKEPVTTNPE